VFSQDRVSVTALPASGKEARIVVYGLESIDRVYADIPRSGYGHVIIPGFSELHQRFALKASSFAEFASKPLIGWVSGFDLADLGKTTAKVYDGRSAQALENAAVVMHVALASGKLAEIEIINIFEKSKGDVITFSADGFSAKTALVNGQEVNLADYLVARNVDTRLPLVADYLGTMVNISFQAVDRVKREVLFYAPVFRGVEYSLATPVRDYVQEFGRRAQAVKTEKIQFTCNCILNYLYAELEGKPMAVSGPATFGEVAYQLLNQTMVYLSILDAR
jgi:hypothetical protein